MPYGFGHNIPNKYGSEPAPLGWPLLVDWSLFKGPAQSCSFALCTEIIYQMLDAQGIDPLQHGPLEENENAEEEENLDDAEEEVENIVPRKRRRVEADGIMSTDVVQTITQRQEREEQELPAFVRRRQNIVELYLGLQEFDL